MISCNKRMLPQYLELNAERVLLMMRKRPYIIHKNGKDNIHISKGIVTVIDPGNSPFLEAGMMFSLDRREIVADKIMAKNIKYKGSNNHHKFIVEIFKAKFLMENNANISM